MRVSVVLPVANQADHLERVVAGFARELAGLSEPWELILVVNKSRDGTLEVARAIAAKRDGVRMIESAPGWGRAVKAGIAAATGDVICYTNSARTDAHDLALCIHYALVNEDLAVKASRKVRESVLRRLGSVLYNFEARALFGLSLWDVNGTPKVFSRRVLSRLELTEDGDLIDLEFVVHSRLRHVPIVEVPVYFAGRHGGRSTTNFGSAWRMYWGALQLYRRHRAELRSTQPPTRN